MKTKTIFMLAAMLLMSIGAFAQNNEPLEGDVNKDGKVDVADIVKVIDIMAAGEQPQPTVYYWYVGYNQDAYDNPQSFKANMYTTNTNAIPTEYSKDGNNGLDVSGTGTRPNYLIMIIPSTWSKPIIYGQLKDAEVGMTLEKQNITITGISDVTFNVYSGTGEMSDSQVFIN